MQTDNVHVIPHDLTLRPIVRPVGWLWVRGTHVLSFNFFLNFKHIMSFPTADAFKIGLGRVPFCLCVCVSVCLSVNYWFNSRKQIEGGGVALISTFVSSVQTLAPNLTTKWRDFGLISIEQKAPPSTYIHSRWFSYKMCWWDTWISTQSVGCLKPHL